jgi:hypothetical protein
MGTEGATWGAEGLEWEQARIAGDALGQRCRAWVLEKLARGLRQQEELRQEAGEEGFSVRALYEARKDPRIQVRVNPDDKLLYWSLVAAGDG